MDNTDSAAVVAEVTTKPKRWYVVHAYSGFENYVKKALSERIQRDGLEDKFGEILVPTEEVVELRAGQKRKSERKHDQGHLNGFFASWPSNFFALFHRLTSKLHEIFAWSRCIRDTGSREQTSHDHQHSQRKC